MYLYKWPRRLWWLRRFLFGETWGEWIQRMKIPEEWAKEEKRKS